MNEFEWDKTNGLDILKEGKSVQKLNGCLVNHAQVYKENGGLSEYAVSSQNFTG